MGSVVPPSWTPPPDQVTRPDQLPAEGWRVVELLEGEHVLACWRASRGYLVLTNLRSVVLRRTEAVLRPTVWEPGPQFFFYNVQPPRVVLGRYVELAEQYAEQAGGLVSRLAVSDPAAVAAAIAAAIPAGQAEWMRRRSESQRQTASRRERQRANARAFVGSAPAEVARVRCDYCGNLTPVSTGRCSSCGAPLR